MIESLARLRAASMRWRYFLTRFWPMYSASVWGDAGVKARVVVKRSAADDALESMSIVACHCFFLTESHIFCCDLLLELPPIRLHFRAGVLSAAQSNTKHFSKIGGANFTLASVSAASAARSS